MKEFIKNIIRKIIIKKELEELKKIRLVVSDYKGYLVGATLSSNSNKIKLPSYCGLYVYQIRHDGSQEIPMTLENGVSENFYANIFSDKELLPNNKDYFIYDKINLNEFTEFEIATTAYDLLMNKDKIINIVNQQFGYSVYDSNGNRITESNLQYTGRTYDTNNVIKMYE